MWTTRFFTEFRDDDQGKWRVDIQAPEYIGAPARLTPAGNPLEWMSSGSESQTENIIGSTGTLRLLIENAEEMALFTSAGVLPSSALSRRVIVTREALTVWVGYVQMQTFSQDWEAAPVEIELPLMDTVEALNHIYIDTDETATTTMQLLRSAYAKALQGDGYQREKKAGQTPTGYEVGGVNVTDFARCDTPQYYGRTGPSASKMWSDAQVFTAYYVGPELDGERKTYSEAIAQILAPFGRISQIGARWFIGKYHTSTANYYHKPNPANPDNWTIDQNDPTCSAVPVNISDAVAGADNNQSVLPIPSKVTATYRPEEGAVDYSGDSIVEFSGDNIKSNASGGAAIDVRWTDGEGSEQKSHHLLYLCIGNGISGSTLDWPVTLVDRKHYHLSWNVESWTGYDEDAIKDRVIHFYSGARFPSFLSERNVNRTWRQALNHDEGWKTSEAQTYCMSCNITREWNDDRRPTQPYNTWYNMWGDIVTLAINDELVTSDTFALSLKFAMKTERLTDEASFIGENENTKMWQPMVQLYWSEKKGVTPTKVYNRTTGKWNTCQGYFFPDNGHDVTMVRYEEIKNGKLFHFPENHDHGFLSMRIYSSGWPADGEDMTVEAPNWHHVNNPEAFFVMTGFKLEYNPWVGSTPNTLLAWNESFRDEKTVTYNNGTEELSLQFKTLAGAEPTPDAFLAPRWGYNDYAMNVVRTPREMVDINAVQVTTDSDIPGVTRFSLFQFQVKEESAPRIYYPAAIGMTAKDNTVRLKLIRTL